MSKPRVLLDIDGVCADFLTPFLDRINHHMMETNIWDRPRHVGEMRVWDAYDAFEVPPEIRTIVDAEVVSPGFCTELLPFSGACVGVRDLMDFADVYVVTSPWTSSETWEYERRRWVKKYLGIDKSRVISTSAKHVCAGDYIVDDKKATLIEWQRCHPDGEAIRFLGPANMYEDYERHSVGNFVELVELIRDSWATGNVERSWVHHD